MLEESSFVISDEQNMDLHKILQKKEVKNVVMGLNKSNPRGPNGVTGSFYQESLDIVGEYIYNMVRALFCGIESPRFINLTNLVLLPKKTNI